jgi:hypothetical protein
LQGQLHGQNTKGGGLFTIFLVEGNVVLLILSRPCTPDCGFVSSALRPCVACEALLKPTFPEARARRDEWAGELSQGRGVTPVQRPYKQEDKKDQKWMAGQNLPHDQDRRLGDGNVVAARGIRHFDMVIREALVECVVESMHEVEKGRRAQHAEEFAAS